MGSWGPPWVGGGRPTGSSYGTSPHFRISRTAASSPIPISLSPPPPHPISHPDVHDYVPPPRHKRTTLSSQSWVWVNCSHFSDQPEVIPFCTKYEVKFSLTNALVLFLFCFWRRHPGLLFDVYNVFPYRLLWFQNLFRCVRNVVIWPGFSFLRGSERGLRGSEKDDYGNQGVVIPNEGEKFLIYFHSSLQTWKFSFRSWKPLRW